MSHFFDKTDSPYIIAGPCSIESRTQFSESVEALSQIAEVSMIRCGVWKPRTRPGDFEGMGEEALRWIAEQKPRYPHLRFAAEVASPAHLELCLRYGIDAVWIGARTSGNPFSVSELCEAMRGVSIPVLVKNPLIPDIKLWAGAIERVRNAGIAEVAAVHRGFYLDNNLGYRNNPLWKIPIELKRQHPDLPLFCDPSHICG
ncbi:MAG: 3-deoxy-7-phosphoheptulonate synthase, partial [Bacteroidales bacterium]|nr:3-deoxy-7-phosphoheptulonate synthase [Bacteroidales bacterium]